MIHSQRGAALLGPMSVVLGLAALAFSAAVAYATPDNCHMTDAHQVPGFPGFFATCSAAQCLPGDSCGTWLMHGPGGSWDEYCNCINHLTGAPYSLIDPPTYDCNERIHDDGTGGQTAWCEKMNCTKTCGAANGAAIYVEDDGGINVCPCK
jgi:hypothetical protein